MILANKGLPLMSDLTLIIGNKNYSSWSLRPWFWMQHLGIEFGEKRIPLYTDQSNAQLEQYYSNYQVPVLLDGEFIVWDSLSILEYLAESFPHFKGLPDDREDRSMVRSVCAEMHSGFTAVRTELPMNCRKTFTHFNPSQAARKDIERITALWRYFRRRYESRGPWLFGEFTIADAMFAPVVLRFKGYSIALQAIELEYVDFVLSHRAIIQWIEAAQQETEILERFEFDSV